MSDSPSLSPVGQTAVGVARIRAAESARPDRLFNDRYAAAFADAAGELLDLRAGHSQAARELSEKLYMHVVVRTRFFDDYLARAAESGCTQIVLLAAGLDTRAYRLSWPNGTRLFELDTPSVLDFKERVLEEQGAATTCERVSVPVDLREDWPSALLAAGHHASEPTAWLVEGLFVYLTTDQAEELLGAVTHLSAPGSRLSFESGFVQTALTDRYVTIPSMSAVTSLWEGGMVDREPEWLVEHGWSVEMHLQSELAASYGRPYESVTAGGFLEAQHR